MPRRLNYTNRQRISREDISIQLRKTGSSLTFDAELRLNDYKLDTISPPPQVYVEAYRGASALWKRFDFGRFGTTAPPTNRSLDEFGVPEGVLFRVKVSATGDDSFGRLLAEADAIRPRLPDEKDGLGLPLIQHVAAEDIGDELWRVTDFDGALPLLKVNSRLPMGVDQFLRDPRYRALVMPSVMRQVLTRILILDRDAWDEEDRTSWQVRWLNFATNLPGVGQRPEPDEPGGILRNAEDFEQWIDSAVESFTARAGLFAAFTEPSGPEGQP